MKTEYRWGFLQAQTIKMTTLIAVRMHIVCNVLTSVHIFSVCARSGSSSQHVYGSIYLCEFVSQHEMAVNLCLALFDRLDLAV